MKKFIYQLDMDLDNYYIEERDLDGVIKTIFNDIDNGLVKVDEIFLESHSFLPSECPSNNTKQYLDFKNRNINIAQGIIDAAHQRGIKCHLHHRMCEVDISIRGGKGKTRYNPIKLEHPDWVIKTWWKEGMWNLASEGLRKFKTEYISNMMHEYTFDGICIDFSRHLPCLPVGKQWEMRECVTEFFRGIKNVLSDIENVQIGAKVPENQKACKVDGFDVEKWADENLVDFYIVGSRSMSVEIEWYKEITKGKNISIYPCWDSWHSSDAYHRQDKEFFRALFSNWLEKGADGIVVFNITTVGDKNSSVYQKCKSEIFDMVLKYCYSKTYYDAFLESGDCDKERKYAVERRGGYPYLTGSFGTNEFAPLPCILANDDTPSDIPIEVYSDYKGKKLKLSLVISGAKPGIDNFGVWVNGIKIENFQINHKFIDKQIFYPKPQYIATCSYCITDDPSYLLNITSEIDGDILKYGLNIVSVAVLDRTDYWLDEDISIERVEIFYE